MLRGTETQNGKIREAVGIFADEKHLDDAIYELEATAFSRQDISVLGKGAALKDLVGDEIASPTQMEDNALAPRSVPVMREEKAIGGAVLVGVIAYIGGCLGALAASGLDDATLLAAIAGGSVLGAIAGGIVLWIVTRVLHANLKKQVAKGGLLLWVQTADEEREKLACRILEKHGGKHVHVHEIT